MRRGRKQGFSSVAFGWRKQGKAGVGAGERERESKGCTEWKQKRGRHDVGAQVELKTKKYPDFRVLLYWQLQLPSRKDHSLLNKMCHADVVTGGSAGRMVGRSNKEILSVQVSPQHGHSHTGLYWLSSLFHHKAHRFIWRENWKLSLSTIMTETDDRTEHKLGMHTKHVWIYSISGFL